MAPIKFTKGRAKVYLKAINSWKKKTMTVADLAAIVGIYEDVIRDQLAIFDPMIRMMDDVNVIDLKPQLEEYVEVVSKKTTPRGRGPKLKYKDIADFVYRNMTVAGGIVDGSIKLNHEQLKDLKKLVNEEYKKAKIEK